MRCCVALSISKDHFHNLYQCVCTVWCAVVLKLPDFQGVQTKPDYLVNGQSAFELQPYEVVANHSAVVKLKLLQDWEIHLGLYSKHHPMQFW